MPKCSRASENQSENNYASVGSGIHWWTWPQEARKTAMEVGMGVLWISKKIRTQSCYLLTTHFVPSTYVLYIHFLIVSFLQDRDRKIPGRREWPPTPVFLPGESPWTEEPGGLQSMGSPKVRHDWETKYSTAYQYVLYHSFLPSVSNSVKACSSLTLL